MSILLNSLILISIASAVSAQAGADCGWRTFEPFREKCLVEGIQDDTYEMALCEALESGLVTDNGEFTIDTYKANLQPLVVNQQAFDTYIRETKSCTDSVQGKDRTPTEALEALAGCPLDEGYDEAFDKAFCG